MHIGVLTIDLQLLEADSLKEKRQILKSLIETTRQRFNVSIAEVDHLDLWRRATLAVVCVSNAGAHTNRVLDKVLDYVESNPSITVAGVQMELM